MSHFILFVVKGAKIEHVFLILMFISFFINYYPFKRKVKNPEIIILELIYFFVNLYSKLTLVLLAFCFNELDDYSNKNVGQ